MMMMPTMTAGVDDADGDTNDNYVDAETSMRTRRTVDTALAATV
jgi:hypothetical protein